MTTMRLLPIKYIALGGTVDVFVCINNAVETIKLLIFRDTNINKYVKKVCYLKLFIRAAAFHPIHIRYFMYLYI